MQKNDKVVTTIEGMTNEGNGVARVEGMAVFVPYSAVGDEAEIRIEKVQKTFAYGRITELCKSSPARIDPDCSSYLKCGGCCFRHITYDEELLYKEQFVKDSLKRIGGLDCDVSPIISSPITEFYRNKVQFPVFSEEGKLYPGFFAERSHRPVKTSHCCTLQDSSLNKIAEDVCSLLTNAGFSAYDEKTFKGLMRHILLRKSSTDGSVLLCLVVNAKHIELPGNFVSDITKLHSEIQTIIIDYNRTTGNEILSADCETIYGPGYIEDEICSVPVRITALSFFQINHASTEILYSCIKEAASPKEGDVLIDLYCGAGTIGLSVTSEKNTLYGIEIIPDAVESAKSAAERMNLSGSAHFMCGDSSLMKTLSEQGVKPDIIITDPPRKGCSKEVIDSMVEANPKKIVMVSCNAATLARDIKLLSEKGYIASSVQPVDLFPRTKHVETVVLMSRNKE